MLRIYRCLYEENESGFVVGTINHSFARDSEPFNFCLLFLAKLVCTRFEFRHCLDWGEAVNIVLCCGGNVASCIRFTFAAVLANLKVNFA